MSKEQWIDRYEHSEESSRMADRKSSAYELRVRALEAEGLTRSDAQGAVDAEDLAAEAEERRQYRAWRNDSGV